MSEQSIFPITMTAAGSQVIKQFSGVLRVIQMADSAGALNLTGMISVRTGQTKGPVIPLRMNNAIFGEATRDLVLSWEAQAGVIATIMISPSAAAFDVDADPPVQLVTGSLASTITAAAVSVDNTATLVAAANTGRQALTIWNDGAATVFLGGAAVTTAAGLPLKAGTGIDFSHTTAAIYAIAAAAGPYDVRYLEEG